MAALSNVSVLSTIEANKQNYIGDLRAKLIAAGISIEFSDDFLIKFLRARLYNCDQTCDLIRTYLSNFQKHPEFFNGFQYVRQPLENGVFEILPDRNVTGETLILMRPGKWEPNLCAFNVATAATIYGVEMDKLSEESQISGTIEIIDMQDVGLKQFLRVGISEARLMAKMTEYSLPNRWSKIFILNESNFTDLAYALVKPFLSSDLKEKIYFIGKDFGKLHQFVPSHLLPEEYGTSNYVGNDKFLKKCEEMEPKLIELWNQFKHN